MSRLLLALTFAFVAACTTETLDLGPGGGLEPPPPPTLPPPPAMGTPKISVCPSDAPLACDTPYDLGVIDARSAQGVALLVHNVGDATLTITRITGLNASVFAPVPFDIEAGGVREARVVVMPAGRSVDKALVEFGTNATPASYVFEIQFDVTDPLPAPHIELCVQSICGTDIAYDFSSELGRVQAVVLEVRSVGASALVVSSSRVENRSSLPGELAIADVPLGLLEPGVANTQAIAYQASDGLRDEADLIVGSNDPDAPIARLHLSGVCTNCSPVMHPQVPDASSFAWQNVQTSFWYENGRTCTGRITVAMGRRAVCYAASDGWLKCAGTIFDHPFGPTFTATHEFDVDQVMIRSASDNGMCALSNGEIRCMGDANMFGVYGTGGTADVHSMTQWGTSRNFVHMGTGTWDMLCALDRGGNVFCSGYGFGATPALAATGATTFWQDTFGVVHTDDPAVWRAAQGRTECQVGPRGLECAGSRFGLPGEVVDGSGIDPVGGLINDAYCWLTNMGNVECSSASRPTFFQPGRVLMLAADQYTDSLCAVYDDGSLWCVGTNDQGKLGTGDFSEVLRETEVQPPGSVRIDCQ